MSCEFLRQQRYTISRITHTSEPVGADTRACASWGRFLVLPTSYLASLFALYLLHLALGDRFASVSSFLSTGIGVLIVWKYYVLRFAPKMRFWWPFGAFLTNSILTYYLWTRYMMAPQGGWLLAGGRAEPGADSFTTWQAVTCISEYWANNGFTVLMPFERVPNNHPIAMMIVSFPFSIIPTYSEALIPWNAFYGVLTASAVLGIARSEGVGASESSVAFRIALLNPFVWIATPIWRNTMEQAVFALSLLALLISGHRSLIASLCLLFIFAPLSYFYRSQYAIVYLVALAYQYAFRNQKRYWWSGALVIGFLALLIFAGGAPVQNLVFDPVRHYILESGPNRFGKGFTSIPYRLFFGLLTPFPWTNTLDAISPYHLAKGVADHIMSVLGVAIFSSVLVEVVSDLKRHTFPPVSVAFGLASVLSGCSWDAIHNVYVHVGMIFLLPYTLKVGSRRFLIHFFASLYALILGNIFWLVIR